MAGALQLVASPYDEHIPLRNMTAEYVGLRTINIPPKFPTMNENWGEVNILLEVVVHVLGRTRKYFQC